MEMRYPQQGSTLSPLAYQPSQLADTFFIGDNPKFSEEFLSIYMFLSIYTVHIYTVSIYTLFLSIYMNKTDISLLCSLSEVRHVCDSQGENLGHGLCEVILGSKCLTGMEYQRYNATYILKSNSVQQSALDMYSIFFSLQ